MVLCLFACGGPKETTIGKKRADHGYGPNSLPAEFRGQQPALSNAAVIGFLPDTTLGALFLANPQEADASLEFSAILSEYTELNEIIKRRLTTKSGASLLAPKTWSGLGVAPDRPAGLAMLRGPGVVGVFFATLSDKALFRRSLDLLGEQWQLGAIVAASAGESTIYVFQESSDFALVVRGEVVMVVVPARSRDLEKQVLAVAGATTQATLASTGRIAKAFAGFDFGSDMAAFVSFDQIASKFLDQMDRIDQLDQMDRVSGSEREKEGAAARRLIQDLFGGVGTIAVGVELAGGTTRLRMQLSPLVESLAAKLLAPARLGPARLGPAMRKLSLSWLRETPLFALGGHLNTGAAIEIFDLFLQADGKPRERFSAEAEKELGVPLDEILALFDGEVAGALTMEARDIDATAAASHAQDKLLGLGLRAHLADPKQARAVFDRICASRKMPPCVAGAGGEKAVVVPGFNRRPIRIEIAGEYLEAISEGGTGFAPHWTKSENELLEYSASLGHMVVDPVLLFWSLRSNNRHYAFQPPPDEEPAATASAKPIRDELAELYRKRDSFYSAQFVESQKSVGRVAASARSYGNGIALLMNLQGTSKNLGRSFQTLVELVTPEVRTMRKATGLELEAVEGRIENLEQSLWTALEQP